MSDPSTELDGEEKENDGKEEKPDIDIRQKFIDAGTQQVPL